VISIGRWALAPLLLALAAPLAAQSTPGPDAGAGQLADELLSEIETVLEKMLSALGPVEPGWSDGAIDQEALIADAPGRPPRLLFTPDPEAPSVWTIGHTPEALLGPKWQRVRASSFGEGRGDVEDLSLFPLGPDRVLAVTSQNVRRGKALCTLPGLGFELIEFERVGAAPPTEEIEVMRVLTERVSRRLKDVGSCGIVRQSGGGLYDYVYTPEGRQFLTLNEPDEEVRVEPAARIHRLLGLRR
jgi:hypothetical protein